MHVSVSLAKACEAWAWEGMRVGVRVCVGDMDMDVSTAFTALGLGDLQFTPVCKSAKHCMRMGGGVNVHARGLWTWMCKDVGMGVVWEL